MRATMKSEIRWLSTCTVSITCSPTRSMLCLRLWEVRHERYVDEQGTPRKRLVCYGRVVRASCRHHPGFIDWLHSKPIRHALTPTFILSHTSRRSCERRRCPAASRGPQRRSSSLGWKAATCGKCGRHLHTHYSGRTHLLVTLLRQDIVEGRGMFCLTVGACRSIKRLRTHFSSGTPARSKHQLAMQQLEADRMQLWAMAFCAGSARYEAEVQSAISRGRAGKQTRSSWA